MTKRWTGPRPAQRRAQARIAAALGKVGFVLPGSVATRSYRCGKPNCACHGDPPRLHGPYIQWTRRIEGKTVHTNLTPDQLADYQPFFDNAQRLRELLDQLEALTLAAIDDDPRSQRHR
jgi:hypothetical protein